jgi:hypothetical protein
LAASLRLRIGAIALATGAGALFAAQSLRPDTGADADAILRSVQAASGMADVASLLYLVAAALLVAGSVAVPSAIASGRGARLIYVAAALMAVGAVWYGVEAALMRFVTVLASSADAAAAASQLDRLNADFGAIALLPWCFYMAPLGVAVALRRARLAGAWIIGLWVLGFAVGFAANSPLGAETPALTVVNDALLSGLVVAIAVVVGVRRPGSPEIAAGFAASPRASSVTGPA